MPEFSADAMSSRLPTTGPHGCHGLIAGCSLGTDVLKSFLLPVVRRARSGKFRDHVDGITLQIVAATSGEAVAALGGDF